MGIIDDFTKAALNHTDVEDIPTAAMESTFFSKDDLVWRKEDWGTKCPWLFITGHSGSGKSTMAKEMSKALRVQVIELDWFDRMDTVKLEETDSNYSAWKLYMECIKKTGLTSTATLHGEERQKYFLESWNHLAEALKRTNKRYIIEGVQVFTLMRGLDEPYTSPIIVKGTSAAVSLMRAYKRGNGRIIVSGSKVNFFACVRMWLGAETRCKEFMSKLLASGEPEVVAF